MQHSLIAYIQIFGVFLALITIWLDTQEKVLARPLTLLGTVLSFFVYYAAGLYAKCLHNVANFLLNIYGWYQWLYGGKGKTSLQISRATPFTLWAMLLLGGVGTLVVGALLKRYTNAALVYWDSAHTMICLIAQWLLARKKIENWIVWLVADILYTPICYYKGLYLFSMLHGLYTILAIKGYFYWRKSYLKRLATLAANFEDEMLG